MVEHPLRGEVVQNPTVRLSLETRINGSQTEVILRSGRRILQLQEVVEVLPAFDILVADPIGIRRRKVAFENQFRPDEREAAEGKIQNPLLPYQRIVRRFVDGRPVEIREQLRFRRVDGGKAVSANESIP